MKCVFQTTSERNISAPQPVYTGQLAKDKPIFPSNGVSFKCTCCTSQQNVIISNNKTTIWSVFSLTMMAELKLKTTTQSYIELFFCDILKGMNVHKNPYMCIEGTATVRSQSK